MAFVFTRDTPVLAVGVREPKREVPHKPLLWPALAYRVVAPRRRERHLNVLQRAVMGLSRAGVGQATTAAEKLHIHPQLAAFIHSELEQLGYLTSGRPTQSGLRALLDDDTDASDEMVVGHVFQDPWSGVLWPRFAERPGYCELEYGANDVYPAVRLGTTGKPRSERPFFVVPERLNHAMPSAFDVVRASARHSKAARMVAESRYHDGDDELTEAPSPVRIGRVSFVDETAQSVFLLTWLAAPDPSDWIALDPFGMGSSLRLRKRIETVSRTDANLEQWIDRWLRNEAGAGLDEIRRVREAVRQQAANLVEHRLTASAQFWSTYERIIDMEAARQELRAAGDGARDRAETALRNAAKALEETFSALTRVWPLGDVWKRVYVEQTLRAGSTRLVPNPDRRLCEDICRAAAMSLGFEQPVPDGFVRQKPGVLRSVAEHGDTRLRALVMAVVLSAEGEPRHPLRAVASRDPHLLDDVDHVAEWGGAAGHATAATPTLSEVDACIDKAYAVIEKVHSVVA